EFLAQYNRQFNNLSLNVNAGANKYTRNFTSVSGSTVGGLSSPAWYSLAASLARPNISSFISRKEIRSIYAMASFGYKDIYFLDASIRRDGSSALPVDDYSYTYPSVSGSIVFSELLKWKPLSFGKIRASYAVAGADFSPYGTGLTYSLGSVYSGTTVINTLTVPDQLNNPNIRPSFAKSFEIGADLKFFKNRAGLEVTYYKQKNEDQTINLSVSGASGVSTAVVNAGLIENKGVELSLNVEPIKGKFFSWTSTINYAENKSMIKELYPGITVYQLDANTYSSVSIFL